MRRQRPSVAHQHDTAPTTQPARSPTKGRQHDGKGLEGGQHCKGGSQPRGEGELTVQQGRRNSGWPATPGLQHLGGNTWATAPRSAAGSMQGCTAQRGSVQAQLRWHAWPRALPCQRQVRVRRHGSCGCLSPVALQSRRTQRLPASLVRRPSGWSGRSTTCGMRATTRRWACRWEPPRPRPRLHTASWRSSGTPTRTQVRAAAVHSIPHCVD